MLLATYYFYGSQEKTFYVTQIKCLPLLPSGPDGVHTHLLHSALP